MSDRLSDYGYSFQIKIISALLRDSSFLQQVQDILDISFFENSSIQWLTDTVIKYHLEYKESPTVEVFKVKLEDLDDVQTVASNFNIDEELLKKVIQ